MEAGELEPDLGPAEPHPSAGATLVTAREPLVAFNVELDTPDPEVARAVAAELREAGGGLAGVRALGLPREGGRSPGLGQRPRSRSRCRSPRWSPRSSGSPRSTAPGAVEAELVGLAPAAALEGYPDEPPIRDFDPKRDVIENVPRLASNRWLRRRRSAAASTAAPRAAGSTAARPAAGRGAAPRRSPGRAAGPRRRVARAVPEPASWSSALKKGGDRGGPLRRRDHGLRSEPGRGSWWSGSLMLGFYVPMAFTLDRFFYQRHLRKEAQKRAEREAQRTGAGRAEPMDVRMFTVGQIAENCFLFRRDGSDRALIVDPGDEAPRILGAAEELGVTIDGILLTHTHFDHIGAVAPVAKATGAPVWCPEIETPVLADINSFVPWPGFGPYESYDADHTVSRRREARARGDGDRRDLHPGPQPGPRHLLGPRRGRRSSPATSSSRARSGAPTCPAATGRRCSSRSARWWTPIRPRPRSIRGTWGSPRWAPSGRRTRSWPSSPASRG